MLIGIATTFFVAALILLLIHRRQRLRGGLPPGDLIYSDAPEQETPVLVSQRYGLKGKPDALVRTASGDVIPVERKKSRAPKRPYAGDLIQATAYCLLAKQITDGLHRSCEFNTLMVALTNRTLWKEKTGFSRSVNKFGKRAAWELLTVRMPHQQDVARAGSVRTAIKPYDTGGRMAFGLLP